MSEVGTTDAARAGAIPIQAPVVAWSPLGARPGRVVSWWIHLHLGRCYVIEHAGGDAALYTEAAVFDATDLAARPLASFAPAGGTA